MVEDLLIMIKKVISRELFYSELLKFWLHKHNKTPITYIRLNEIIYIL